VIAKRKGVVARRGRKEARSKRTSPMYKKRIRGIRCRASGQGTTKPYPSKALVVNPPVACGRRSTYLGRSAVCPGVGTEEGAISS